MPRGTHLPDWQRAAIALAGTAVTVAVVAALYWARSIFIPVALAIFLAFVLGPLVARVQRLGMGRTPAVILTVGLALLLVAGSGALIAQQFAGLANMMTQPERAAAFKAKVTELHDRIGDGGNNQLGQLIDDVTTIIVPKPSTSQPPTPVVVVPDSPAWMAQLQTAFTPATEILGQAAFAFILTVYMLLRKEDLRNRVIRLTGHGKVTNTTNAVDDATRRISKYLLVQLLLNTSFGLLIVVGLLIIGVKYALLWGFLAAMMRYVPYIGTWVGLIPPTLFAFATSDALWTPLAVLGLFGGLELLCNNIFEPWLYGSSMGLSEVAQLVSAAVWAFLWGPIGLILSGPLTVCLLILGKYVTQFRFLEVLLGDEPALEPKVAFYQRLTARDQDEASDIAEQAAKDSTPEAVFDKVIVPALCIARRDHIDGDLSEEQLKTLVASAREIGEGVATEAKAAAEENGSSHHDRVPIVLCPARDEADRVAVDLLALLLDPKRWDVRIAAVDTLASELLELVGDHQAAAVVIGALPPGGRTHSRYLAARLRARFPDVKLLVGRWGRGDEFPDDPTRPTSTGADWVEDTLAATRARLNGLFSVLAANDSVPGSNGKSAAVGTATASVH